MNEKLNKLKTALSGLQKVIIAYSGGVDSSFLLKTAIDVLGKENVLAVIARSPTYPEEEIMAATKLAEGLGANYLIIDTDEFSDSNFISNPKDRCYYCKKELFSKLKSIAAENKIDHILDGSNHDDLADFRPGNRAKTELGILSPLQEAGLTKDEIRKLSKDMGLVTHDKPSMACLASRIPYHTKIDKEALNMINEGERHLRSLGFNQVRVRHHHPVARIEVEKEAIPRLMEQSIMDAVIKKFERLGYFYVTIDLKGYRTGSMNEDPQE